MVNKRNFQKIINLQSTKIHIERCRSTWIIQCTIRFLHIFWGLMSYKINHWFFFSWVMSEILSTLQFYRVDANLATEDLGLKKVSKIYCFRKWDYWFWISVSGVVLEMLTISVVSFLNKPWSVLFPMLWCYHFWDIL